MTVFGWDASDYDWTRGTMDLGAAYRDGIRFFSHKATEGTRTKHVHFGEALRRARDAGVPFIGPYMVPRTPGNGGHGTISAQVDYFLNYVHDQADWLFSYPGRFGQMDTEHWGYDDVSGLTGARACDALRSRTGWQVLHYAPWWAYGDTVPGTDPLWSSGYVTTTASHYLERYTSAGGDNHTFGWKTYSGRVPAIWQFSSTAKIGSQANCDANAFRGTEQDFANMLNNTASPARKGRDMIIMAHERGSNVDWIGDGVHRYKVVDSAHRANALVVMGLQGNPNPTSVEFNPGTLDALGPVVVDAATGVPTTSSVTLTDAQVSALSVSVAQMVVGQHDALSDADLASVQAAAAAALRNVLGGLG